jgi:hypothetical protein
MNELELIAQAAETMAGEPQGPISRSDLVRVLNLISKLAREADKLPKTRPVGRPPNSR